MKICEASLCFYKDWTVLAPVIRNLCRCLWKSVYAWRTRRLEMLPCTVVINYATISTLDTNFITSCRYSIRCPLMSGSKYWAVGPQNRPSWCNISCFCREIEKNCALQGYYAASGDNSLPTFRDNMSAPSSGVHNPILLGFLTLEEGTERLSRNVGKKLPQPSE
jgi:hypothetical protein